MDTQEMDHLIRLKLQYKHKKYSHMLMRSEVFWQKVATELNKVCKKDMPGHQARTAKQCKLKWGMSQTEYTKWGGGEIQMCSVACMHATGCMAVLLDVVHASI